MRVLGIDYGVQRVGLALCDEERTIATPLAAVKESEALPTVLSYLQKKRIFRIAIGDIPEKGAQDEHLAKKLQHFRSQLVKRMPHIRISEVDEHFTSKMAEETLRAGLGAKKRRESRKNGLQDKIAATLILQSFLAQHPLKKLPIITYGAQILRTKALRISPQEEGLQDLIDNMFATMYAASGVGLAAPQVGHNKQLFVMGGPLVEESWYEQVMINPVITQAGETAESKAEGCLSIPDISVKVQRAVEIKVDYTNALGQARQGVFRGTLSRIIQHEYDHLQGRLITDYLSPLQRRLLRKKLDAIQPVKHV